ncbi:MAG: hypothetical protein ABTQ25_13680 [Nitrosomonas ureae]
MASSRSKEIRLWWPLPLATLIWLLAIWGLGFFLSLPEVEIETPPPIAASFIDLEESKDADNSLLASQPSAPAPQPEKPKIAETQPALKSPPPVQPPPSRPPTKPKAAEKPSKPKAPIPAQEVARIKAPPEPPADAPTDLSEYINQAKARRRAAEGIFDSQENTASSSAAKQPSADEIRMANVRRNLQNPGTSGIFQILRIGPRTAEFSFRAWTTGQTNPRLQMIRVEAGIDGDIERAIIRRMIQLIREYYKEDFNWESHRLHRVVVLSARERDTAGLEDFLMREFFINPSR